MEFQDFYGQNAGIYLVAFARITENDVLQKGSCVNVPQPLRLHYIAPSAAVKYLRYASTLRAST